MRIAGLWAMADRDVPLFNSQRQGGFCRVGTACLKVPHCTQLLRNTRPVNKDCLHLGHDLEGAAVRDDDVRVLANLQRADAVGYADAPPG